MIDLKQPSVTLADSFFEAMAEFESEGNPQVPAGLTSDQFQAYVQGLHDLAEGRNLKPGYIPSKEFWIVDADGYAGRIILGLAYYPSPERLGHHVGYAVRPTKRKLGYATQALKLMLEEARNLGIQRLMPTCGHDNVASQKVIEANGGVLLSPLSSEETNPPEQRFLILLDPPVHHG